MPPARAASPDSRVLGAWPCRSRARAALGSRAPQGPRRRVSAARAQVASSVTEALLCPRDVCAHRVTTAPRCPKATASRALCARLDPSVWAVRGRSRYSARPVCLAPLRASTRAPARARALAVRAPRVTPGLRLPETCRAAPAPWARTASVPRRRLRRAELGATDRQPGCSVRRAPGVAALPSASTASLGLRMRARRSVALLAITARVPVPRR